MAVSTVDARADDTELLRQASHGNAAAFHELVDRHAGHLFAVAHSLTGNAADAEDVVQETFTGAFRGLSGFRGQSSVRTWLLRILVRQAARSRRARWRWRTLPIDGSDGTGESASSQLTVPAEAGQVERKADVLTMLATLSPEHREVMVLRELEGMSYEQMAQTLGVPQGTVESRLHRARQELRSRFRGYL